MNTDENVKEVVKEKPQIDFKSIRFNDDTELMLEKNSIVVFTGACVKIGLNQEKPYK